MRSPDGVLSYNDPTAMGAMQAAIEKGVRIPQDLVPIRVPSRQSTSRALQSEHAPQTWAETHRIEDHRALGHPAALPVGPRSRRAPDYARNSAALSAAHSRNVRAGAPVISATVDVTYAG
jgi:hypothetical protein